MIHPLFQSIMLSMMHEPDLNSQMQCGTIHQGNSLSMSTRHSHLGKLGRKCRGHPVVHRQLPPSHGDKPESQGNSKPSNIPPSTSIPPHEKLQVLDDKVYTISMQYEV